MCVALVLLFVGFIPWCDSGCVTDRRLVLRLLPSAGRGLKFPDPLCARKGLTIKRPLGIDLHDGVKFTTHLFVTEKTSQLRGIIICLKKCERRIPEPWRARPRRICGVRAPIVTVLLNGCPLAHVPKLISESGVTREISQPRQICN